MSSDSVFVGSDDDLLHRVTIKANRAGGGCIWRLFILQSLLGLDPLDHIQKWSSKKAKAASFTKQLPRTRPRIIEFGAVPIKIKMQKLQVQCHTTPKNGEKMCINCWWVTTAVVENHMDFCALQPVVSKKELICTYRFQRQEENVLLLQTLNITGSAKTELRRGRKRNLNIVDDVHCKISLERATFGSWSYE